MKMPVYDMKGGKKGEISLGKVFSVSVRADIIRRAFNAESAGMRQPYGSDKLAGMRSSAHYHGKRGYRFSMMNREMARMRRIHGHGFLNFTARIVPQAVKGRRAHPPKTEKIWKKKVNKKEKRLALLSAIAATGQKDYIASRSHRIDSVKDLPIVLEDNVQKLKKTKEVVAVMEALGLKDEMETRLKKVRSGKGKSRGRKYKKRRGPLIIVNDKLTACPPGFDVVNIKDLTVSDLAPGGDPGRLCVWTESSIKDVASLGV